MGKFASEFKRLRLEKGLTQDECAKELGLSRSTIGMYENGKREPDFETLEVIADYFNVPIDSLIKRKNYKTSDLFYGLSYFYDEKAKEYSNVLKENKDYQMFFDTYRDIPPEEISKVVEMIKLMTRK